MLRERIANFHGPRARDLPCDQCRVRKKQKRKFDRLRQPAGKALFESTVKPLSSQQIDKACDQCRHWIADSWVLATQVILRDVEPNPELDATRLRRTQRANQVGYRFTIFVGDEPCR